MSKKSRQMRMKYVAVTVAGGGRRLLLVAKLRPDEPRRGSGIVSASAGIAGPTAGEVTE